VLYRSALGKSHDDTIVLAVIACFERMASVPTGKQKSVEGSLPSPPRALVGAKGGAAEEKFYRRNSIAAYRWRPRLSTQPDA
jgi:hypothetical protein